MVLCYSDSSLRMKNRASPWPSSAPRQTCFHVYGLSQSGLVQSRCRWAGRSLDWVAELIKEGNMCQASVQHSQSIGLDKLSERAARSFILRAESEKPHFHNTKSFLIWSNISGKINVIRYRYLSVVFETWPRSRFGHWLQSTRRHNNRWKRILFCPICPLFSGAPLSSYPLQ